MNKKFKSVSVDFSNVFKKLGCKMCSEAYAMINSPVAGAESTDFAINPLLFNIFNFFPQVNPEDHSASTDTQFIR